MKMLIMCSRSYVHEEFLTAVQYMFNKKILNSKFNIDLKELLKCYKIDIYIDIFILNFFSFHYKNKYSNFN